MAPERQASLWGDAWRQLRRKPLFIVSALLVLLFTVMAIAPGLFTSQDPRECNLSHSLERPSAGHWFGYDLQGCDYYSMTIYGTRPSLAIGLLVVFVDAVIAVVLGCVAAYFGGASHRTATLIFLAPFALAVVAVVLIPFRPAFGVLANEDGIAEWGQWFFLVGLVVIYARLAIALWQQKQRPIALLYLLAMVAVIFTAGEEISWGQRIFGWMTPGALDDINNQGETNIHNIGSILKIFNLVIMTVAFIAALLPIVRWTTWRARARSIAGYALIPPAALIPAFGMEFAYRAIRYLFLPAPRYTLTKLSEIAEPRSTSRFRVRRPRLARHRPRLAADDGRDRRDERCACHRAAGRRVAGHRNRALDPLAALRNAGVGGRPLSARRSS